MVKVWPQTLLDYFLFTLMLVSIVALVVLVAGLFLPIPGPAGGVDGAAIADTQRGRSVPWLDAVSPMNKTVGENDTLSESIRFVYVPRSTLRDHDPTDNASTLGLHTSSFRDIGCCEQTRWWRTIRIAPNRSHRSVLGTCEHKLAHTRIRLEYGPAEYEQVPSAVEYHRRIHETYGSRYGDDIPP